jgi:NADH-quinone oxidoreductase subunit M
MGLSTLLLVVGWIWLSLSDRAGRVSELAVLLLAAGALVRSGVVPVHCWVTDLFEKGSFGTALLFVTPLTGAYALMRLVLPYAPNWLLSAVSLISLVTAVYAAGMALVQREARRFFCYLLLSHASLVLVGLVLATPIGIAGGLCVWLSVGMSLAGFGLTLRAVEARIGRVMLTEYHGLYEQMPILAGLYLLTGLSSIGFPGTVGFIGTEMLVDAAVGTSAWIGGAVVFAAALNGITVLHSYFRVFTGTRPTATISLAARPAERVAVIFLAALILGGGMIPQPGVHSRYRAAMELVSRRSATGAPSVARVIEFPPSPPVSGSAR